MMYREGDYPILDKTASRVRRLARQASAFVWTLFPLLLCLNFISVVVERAKAEGSVLGEWGASSKDIRLQAKPSPVNSLKLIQIGNAANEIEKFQVWLPRTPPGVHRRPDSFCTALPRKEDISEWSRLFEWQDHRDRTGCELDGPVTGPLCYAIQQCRVSPKPPRRNDFQGWPMSEVLDSVVRFDVQIRDVFENINLESSIQSDPRAFISNRNFVLNVGYDNLFFHDASLSIVDNELRNTNKNKRDSKEYFDPVRKFEVAKGFRGLPVALGWFVAALGGWLWVAYIAHEKQSMTLTVAALCFAIAAFGGLYVILWWSNDFLIGPSSTETAVVSSLTGVSATTYGRAEDVRVVSVVVPEFELGNVQRQILSAHLVEAAHDAALQQRPETIDGLRMNDAVDVLSGRVVDGAVVKNVVQRVVGGVFVGRDQANLLGHGLTDEGIQRRGIGAGDDACNHITLSADGADNDCLASAAGSRSAFVGMAVLVLAADVGFIDLDNAHELAEFGISKAGANTVRHIERGFIGAETHHAMDLERGNTFLAGQHQIDDLEPNVHGLIRVLKDRADQHGEPIAALVAFVTLPVKRSGLYHIHVIVVAARAANASRPAPSGQIRLAGIISRKQLFELRNRHLASEFDLAHRSIPDV